MGVRRGRTVHELAAMYDTSHSARRMRSVEVALGSRSYPIHIGPALLPRLGELCRPLTKTKRCAVISDRRVANRYAKAVMRTLIAADFEPVLITIPAGESSKRLKMVQHCYDQLAKHRIERKSLIIALGGGVTGDLAGFVAATYLRGVPFVQVPTTLLAQVDSSVGGKVGVNLSAGKNLVGAFYQPKLVLCDVDTLNSLPSREFRAGLAEVIKYGIIQDADLFGTVERDLPRLLALDGELLQSVVARCCEIKAEIVSGDETESGVRQTLNFGHTIGHAIEAVFGYGRYLHGEAISVGQVAAAALSQQQIGCSQTAVERVRDLFQRAELPVSVPLSRGRFRRLVAAMQLDKKVTQGEIRFVLMEQIGKVRWGQQVPMHVIESVLLSLGEPNSLSPAAAVP